MVTMPSTKPTAGPQKPRNQSSQTNPEPKATKPHPKPESASESQKTTSDLKDTTEDHHKESGAESKAGSSKASKNSAGAKASKHKETEPEETKPQETKQQREMRQLLTDLANHKYKNVVVMAGAGISTASGIPDFRSPKTGLYANLQKFKLPYPEAVFDISYLRKNPDPFFMLCSEMYPTKFKPTRFHHFIRWLNDLGALKRCYTQNIDTLERLAGVPENKIVEAHGSFQKNFCIDCKEEADKQTVEDHILAKRGVFKCEHCDGIVKPGIVFFGEALPAKFFECMEADFEDSDDVDLVIVAGTSLQVGPFNQLPDMVPKKTRRYLINYDQAGSLGRWRGDKLVLGKMESLDDLFDEFVAEAKEKEDTKEDIKKVEEKKNDDKKTKEKKSKTTEIIDLVDKLDIN